MGLKKLYLDIYEQFAKKHDTVKGFKDNVKWWTLDRPKRLTMIKEERDRQQQEILALKEHPKSTPQA